MLCYIENLANINDARAGTFCGKLEEVQSRATELSKILKLFKAGATLHSGSLYRIPSDPLPSSVGHTCKTPET